MRFSAFSLFSLVTMLVMPATAQKPAARTTKRNYVRQQDGFAMHRPQDWEDGPTEGVPNLLVGFFFDTYPRPSIFITAEPSYGTDKFPVFWQGLEAGLRDSTPEYKRLGKTTGAVGGLPAVSITFQLRDPVTSTLLRSRRTWVVRDRKLFSFYLTAPESTFGRYEPAFSRMMRSVQWLPHK